MPAICITFVSFKLYLNIFIVVLLLLFPSCAKVNMRTS